MTIICSEGTSIPCSLLGKGRMLITSGETGGMKPPFPLTAPKVLDITENAFHQF